MSKELDMGQAHINLIHYVMNRGWKVNIIDPDRDDYDEDHRKSFGLKDIDKVIEEIEAWDGGQDFFIEEPDEDLDIPGTGRKFWVGLAIGYGNLPNESVYDFSICEATDDWFKQFMKEHGDDE